MLNLKKIKCDFYNKEFNNKKSMTHHRIWHNLPQYKKFHFKNIKNNLIFCKCGCGKERYEYDSFGRIRGYIKGHYFKNKPKSEEHKRKVSETKKRLFKEGKLINPFKGKHHTEETKRKVSETKKRLFREGKLSKFIGALGEKNPMYGRILERNPNWQGGISFEPYDKRFNNQFKRLIRKRDNYICLKCGKHQEKQSRALIVHHIDYNKKLNIKENCCSLCNVCNSEVNFNRRHWTKFFQSLLSEKYGYKYEEDKIILEIKDA